MSAIAHDLTARPSSLRVWVSTLRLPTLPAAVSPVVVGTAVAWSDGVADLPVALAAAAGALFIQIGTNLFNDYADFKKGADTAERLGPARATSKGWLTPGQVMAATVLAFAVATAFGVYLLFAAGWPVVVIGVTSIVCGIAYTGGPKPLAYVGLGDVFVFIFFGLVAVMGTYFVQASTLSPTSFAAAVPIGLLTTAVLVVNNLRDRHTDAKSGKRTLAVRLGERFTRTQYAVLVVGAFVSVAVTAVLGIHGLGWLLVLACAPLAVMRIRALNRLDGGALNPELGHTAKLGLLFSMLLAVGALL
ncbi:MAG: 1,4-dihydroxy-2-naphthoate polyprenyltransferase [Myxococcota bacterium]